MYVCVQAAGGGRAGDRTLVGGRVTAKGLGDSPIHFRAKFVGATHISMSILVGLDSGKLIVGDG